VPPGTGSASFQSDGIHRLDLRAQSPSGGLLVLKDSWYPGWEAEVDGMRVPVYRVNGCFRGVAVPGGSHRVEFLYRPRGIYIAAAVSLLSLLLLAAFALIRAPRPRVGKEGPPP